MAQTCEKHGFELAVGICRRCGLWFCEPCLVFAFGPKKPPFCVACAINAAGVRSTAGFSPRPPREVKRELRAQRREAKRSGRDRADQVEPDEATAVRATAFDDEVDAWRSGDEIWEDATKR
jgi:hypothetical protein